MPFQSVVNLNPAPANPGDFASANPRATVLAGPGALVAGPYGLQPGLFAWSDANNVTASNFGVGAPTGFVHREMSALITTYLAEFGSVVQPGWPVTLFKSGDFWVKNAGANAVTIGMKAYANFSTGAVTFAATGNPPSQGSVTGSVAASTASVTGSISGDLLTVTAVGSGVLVNGATLSGTGVTAGTTIVAQASGTTGGIGTYYVSALQTVPSTTISATYGTLTVTAVGSGSITVGDVLSGTGVTAGTYVSQFLSGSGGNGTYAVSSNTVVASTTIAATGAIETKWYAQSAGAAGELVKMSSTPNG
jgi:hypothetical protein